MREKMIGVIVKLAGFGVGYLYPTYSALKLLDRKVIGPEEVRKKLGLTKRAPK